MDDRELKENILLYIQQTKKKQILPFFDTVFFHLNKNTLSITCSSFVESKIRKSYQKEIEEYLAKFFNDKITVFYNIDEENNDMTGASAESTPKTTFTENQKIIKEEKFKAKNHNFCKLNPFFTFENFIEGQNNSYAKKMAMLASSHLGSEACNPLLILGQVGMGKTHLMQAIANQILTENPNLNVVCIGSQDLIDTLYNNIQDKINNTNNNNIYSSFENADAFLIDDIHLFKGKDGLQHELFVLFNKLKENKKQICFTCDRPISEIHNFQERIASRIKSGITVDLSEPTADVKYKILKQKTKQLKEEGIFRHTDLELEDDVYFYFSENIHDNIRDMEGILKSFLFTIDFQKNIGTLKDAEDFLKENNNISKNKKEIKITTDMVIRKVADFYNVTTTDIKSVSRKQKYALCRQIAIYITCDMTSQSTTEIGDYFQKDHTTIMHSRDKISSKIIHDEKLKKEIEQIKKEIVKSCQ